MIITGGKFKGQKILAPDEKITRPTLSKVRMAVFNTLQAIIDFEECSFLDFYAGSGIMGLEALSRGFSNLTACEKNPKVAKILKTNCQKFSSKANIQVLVGDSLKLAQKMDKKFDVIYIDPPYFSGVYEASLSSVERIADIVILEHVVDVDFSNWEIIKQKKYSDKLITFITYKK